MSTAAHTPGPWFVNGPYDSPCDYFIRTYHDEEHFDIACANVDETGNSRANARLIAAAPELLEALESFLRCPSVGSDGPGTSTLRVMDYHLKSARAAIAKATTPEA